MLFFGLCFLTYVIRLSEKNGFSSNRLIVSKWVFGISYFEIGNLDHFEALGTWSLVEGNTLKNRDCMVIYETAMKKLQTDFFP